MILRIILLMAFLAIPQWVSAEITITRSFSKITLGMSIEALQATYEIKEIASSSLLPGERFFGVDRQFPRIDRVWCTFYLGKLFRIEFSYFPQYSQEVPWEEFVEFVKKGYGDGWSFESPNGPVIMWNDGKTSFIIERKTTPRSSSVYVVSLIDDGLYNARQESCPAKKYKA